MRRALCSVLTLAGLAVHAADAAPPAEVVWHTPAERSPASVLVSGDRAYVDYGLMIEVLDAANARLLTTLYQPVEAFAGATQLRIRGRSISAHIVSKDAPIWSVRLELRPHPPLTVFDGKVLIASSGGNGGDDAPENDLTLVNASTGKRLWDIRTGRWASEAPVVMTTSGLIVTGCQAFRIKDGGPAWEAEVCNERPMPVPREEAGVIDIWDRASVATIAIATGKETAARVTLPLRVETRPVVADGVAAAGTETGVLALDLATRQVRWQAPSPHVTHGPVLAGSVLWVVSDDGVVAFDPATGVERCRHAATVDSRSELYAARELMVVRTKAAKAMVVALRCAR